MDSKNNMKRPRAAAGPHLNAGLVCRVIDDAEPDEDRAEDVQQAVHLRGNVDAREGLDAPDGQRRDADPQRP